MDLRTLTKLALKLAGVYVITIAIIGAVGHVANPAPNTALWFFTVYGLYLLLGSWLLWFPLTTAR
jgi:hypothetical protein